MKSFRFYLSIFLTLSLLGSALPVQALLLPSSSSNVTYTPAATNSSRSNSDVSRSEMGSEQDSEEKVPGVDIVLTPTNPREDEVIYAQAMPSRFRNTSAKLYYNWYIFNPDAEVGTTVVRDGSKTFIPSNTLEGALIRGAVAQARGEYIPGTTPKASELGTQSESAEEDKDGYTATYGGDGGKGAIDEEIEDILGKSFDYSYEDFQKNCKQNCNVRSTNSNEEAAWEYKKCSDPECIDWFDDCCSACQTTFGQCVDDAWEEIEDDCLDEICSDSKKERKRDCLRSLANEDYEQCTSDFWDEYSDCKSTRDLCCLNQGSCGSKPSQDCSECEQDYYEDLWISRKDKDMCRKKCEVKESNILGSPSIEPVGSRCFRYNFGGSDVASHITGIFQPITCVHYFPGADNPGDDYDWGDSIISFETGDGDFEEREEIFWGTDPTNADTDGDGFPDEADIVGLGQQTIQFTYKKGDRIGVVVEGTSLLPTNEKTPYYKNMWAFLGICTSEVIKKWDQEDKEFENLCECDRKKDGKCTKSDEFGFGYLGMESIWQRADDSSGKKLDSLISIFPLRPAVGSKLNLRAIVTGNELDRDVLFYEWTFQHEGDNLLPEKDERTGKIVWKKQGMDVAYTHLRNKAADFSSGGMGWNELDLEPLLEGNYTAGLKAVETQGSQQKMGEAVLSFEVTEKLKLRFYRAIQDKGKWKKADELLERRAIEGEDIMVEYEGPFYEDFAWYIDKQRWEGNNPKLAFRVNKFAPAEYKFRLVAANRSRSNIAEDEDTLEVTVPYTRIRPDEQADTQSEEEDSFIYYVPLDTDLTFVAWKGPLGSSFASRDDITYIWSFDEGKLEKGEVSYSLKLEKDKYMIETPHTLAVKIYESGDTLIAEDKITLIPREDKNLSKNKKDNPWTGLAFAYMNIPQNLKFTLQTILWVCFLYLLLSSISWLTKAGER